MVHNMLRYEQIRKLRMIDVCNVLIINILPPPILNKKFVLNIWKSENNM